MSFAAKEGLVLRHAQPSHAAIATASAARGSAVRQARRWSDRGRSDKSLYHLLFLS